MGGKRSDDSSCDNFMSSLGFHMMAFLFRIHDALYPLPHDLSRAGISEGMVVVDYGCGPGRYIELASDLAGRLGIVYAVDIHPVAISMVEKKKKNDTLDNVRTVLVKGYSSGIPGNCADVIYAFDMFHNISNPTEFLTELHRIIAKDGMLLIDCGHQKPEDARRKILNSGLWEITSEEPSCFVCRPGSIS